MMKRTQIQLPAAMAQRLKRLAVARGRSMADLIREGVELVLARAGEPDVQERRARALAVVGRYRSGIGDVAEKHDEHLADLYGS